MSTRRNNGSHYENHQLAAELHNESEHAHRAAGQHGQEEHLSGTEQSRHEREHSQLAFVDGPQAHAKVNEHGVPMFGHKEIAALAHSLWQQRGCPEGSPEEDWYRAAEQLRSNK
jgi:hypothetical protein